MSPPVSFLEAKVTIRSGCARSDLAEQTIPASGRNLTGTMRLWLDLDIERLLHHAGNRLNG
jgi:hypothetical protein